MWGGRKVKREHSKKTSSKPEKKNFFQKMGRKHHNGHDMSCLKRGEYKVSTNTYAPALCYTRPRGASREAVHACPCPKVPQQTGKVVKTDRP